MLVTLPSVFALDEFRAGNRVRQIAERGDPVEGSFSTVRKGRSERRVFRGMAGLQVLVISKKGRVPQADDRVVYASDDLKRGQWVKHPLHRKPDRFDHGKEIAAVLASWRDAFSYIEEDPDRGIAGLRKPQIGAVHAVHAHWASSSEPATIVMPTGTGKTDTMIAIIVSALCEKVAVVVPTDALRTQLAGKFLTLGVLKTPGSNVLRPEARYPIVATLDHIPKSAKEVDQIFGRAQIIVMTSAIAGKAKVAVQQRMAHHCEYLFIDEAHHIEAPTWSAFKSRFRERRILQFTATPFREDGKLLDGKIIFKYPLKKAQEERYFEPIHFEPVHEFIAGNADEAIATKAVEQLRSGNGKHILMARVETIERARKVFEIYERLGKEFQPVELHTGIKSKKKRDEAKQKILDKKSRIVVCVDMLGEGFDLPELKIAAFHDIRKTLAVTLQLAGRFIRFRPDLGQATFIANVADIDVQNELRKLYTRDPDWNALLPELSEELVSAQMSLQEFLRGFGTFPDEIPLKALRPALSTVVYKTRCRQWKPEHFRRGIPNVQKCDQIHHALNAAENTMIVVAARRTELPWLEGENLFKWDWELYVLFWDEDQELLFINGSTNAGEYRKLAQAVAGEDVELIRGLNVFRAFAGVTMLRLQNVGLTEVLGRKVRYTGRMGSDVAASLSRAILRGTRKTVLAGFGYEYGAKASVGGSWNGRIWAHRRQAVDGLVGWCRRLGEKLLDERIDPDEVLRGTLVARTIAARPDKLPLFVDWPEEMYKSSEGEWWVVIDGGEWHLSELSLDLVDPSESGPLRMAIRSESERVEFVLELLPQDYRFAVPSGRTVAVRRGRSSDPVPLEGFCWSHPPVLWFIDGSFLEGNQLIELSLRRRPYDPALIDDWTWAKTDLNRESQGKEKDPQTVQARVIRKLKARKRYVLIFDDDDAGELADVVAVHLVGPRNKPTKIEVELYHCKFSGKPKPGQRVKDLYEVCGQAQKSVSWMASRERQTDLFTHLLRREAARIDARDPTRIELGSRDELLTLQAMSRLHPVELKVFIVQPGLSKTKPTDDQLELLAVTENHLATTYQIPFGVIASR